MNFRFRLCLATLALAIGLMYFAPVALAQEQQRPSPPPSEVTPPQTPSETPSTGEQGNIRRSQNGSNTSPRVAPETYARDSHSISWGSLIFGLILGGAIGYLAGRQPKPVEGVRRDRAA